MNPVGDINVIKAILLKSCEKWKTAQIDFDHGRYNDSKTSFIASTPCLAVRSSINHRQKQNKILEIKKENG